MTIAVFSKLCSKNVSGNTQIFIAEAANITAVTVTSGEISGITGNNAFKEIQVEMDSILRTEEKIAGKQNYAVDVSVEIKLARPSVDINTLRTSLGDASPCGMAALVKDGNGTWWLVGYNELDLLTRPLFLSQDNMTSGAELIDPEGNKVSAKIMRSMAEGSLPLDSTLAAEIDAGTAIFCEYQAFNPSDISDLIVWFDPLDTANLVLEAIGGGGWNGAGDYVQKWTDKIGGAEVQETTDAWQPFYDPAEGKLICDGNQRLPAITNALSGLDNAITVVMLVKRNTPLTDSNSVFELHDGSSDGRKIDIRADGDMRHYSNAGIDFTANNDFTNLNWNTVFQVYNGASSAIYRENVSKATGTSANDSGLDEVDILCTRTLGNKFDGSLGDFLIYGKALDAAERSQLQTWLNLRK